MPKPKIRNKPRLCIALFHRDKHSLDESLGLARYHWAILIRPKHIKHPSPSESYDVTDADITREWKFRVRKTFDVVSDARFLGAVVIGKVEGEIEGFLRDDVPLPKNEEGENCVSWTREAVRVLREKGVVDVGVEMEEVVKEAMRLGDEVMRNGRAEKVEGMFRYLI